MDRLNQFVHQHWQLSLAFVVILAIIYVYEYLNSKKQGKSLSPEAVVNLMNHQEATVFDLRADDLYRKGHIIKAVRVTSHDFDQPKMDKYKSKPIVLVCARGVESAALATKLRSKGYQNPMILAGGVAAWQAANLPLVKK